MGFEYIKCMKNTKIKALIVKKKYIIVSFLIILILLLCCFIPKIASVTSPKTKYTVVIDAGHGGIDGGSVGVSTGVIEANLNLDYAKCLRQMLTDFGFNVVMTRTTESGLYNPLASNKKKDDMKKRKQIVEKSNADFVVSIHMNSYNKSAHGAQVFYGADDEPSKALAQNIQSYFIKNLSDARSEAKVGDYYILNAIKAPSVLVECGYLSNPNEEALLISEEYKQEICYNILLGILSYLS